MALAADLDRIFLFSIEIFGIRMRSHIAVRILQIAMGALLGYLDDHAIGIAWVRCVLALSALREVLISKVGVELLVGKAVLAGSNHRLPSEVCPD